MEEGKTVLVITNMFPSENNKSFGSFVKVHTDAFKEYTDVKQFIVANTDQRTGLIRLLVKYGNLLFKTIYFSLFKNFDVIHAHYAFPTGFIGLISKYITDRPLIITVHGGDINKMARKNNITFKLSKISLNKADAVITVSEDIKRKLKGNFGVDDNKIHVINMGVDIEIFKPLDKNQCRDDIGISKNKNVVLFVGNLIPRKGVVYLIDAINLVKKSTIDNGHDNLECILLGGKVDKKYLDLLYEKIHSLGIDDSISFIEPVHYEEVALWMNATDILVLPSLEEPFGLAALEALACGVPTIATSVGGLKEFINESTGYSVPPKDPDAIAKCIMTILNNKNGRTVLIRNKGQKLAKMYSTVNQIKKIKRIYESLTISS